MYSQGKDEREPKDESADERLRRRAYERGCQRLKKRIEGQLTLFCVLFFITA